MRTGARAAVALVIALAGACFVPSQHAGAGGSVWYFDRDRYEPGDVVVAAAAVSWGHNSDLGTPDDGPYGVWIATNDSLGARSHAEQVEWARYVTDVRIEPGPGDIDGVRYAPNIARARFVLPDVPPGYYALLHCNYPCTKALGDITFGGFWVGTPAEGSTEKTTRSQLPAGLGAAPVVADPRFTG